MPTIQGPFTIKKGEELPDKMKLALKDHPVITMLSNKVERKAVHKGGGKNAK